MRDFRQSGYNATSGRVAKARARGLRLTQRLFADESMRVRFKASAS